MERLLLHVTSMLSGNSLATDFGRLLDTFKKYLRRLKAKGLLVGKAHPELGVGGYQRQAGR
jgi:hypothetical protein